MVQHAACGQLCGATLPRRFDQVEVEEEAPAKAGRRRHQQRQARQQQQQQQQPGPAAVVTHVEAPPLAEGPALVQLHTEEQQAPKVPANHDGSGTAASPIIID